ncbi:MAG: S1 RNA-binding domain-containing protein, partial [Comamonadaceae bacterium]
VDTADLHPNPRADGVADAGALAAQLLAHFVELEVLATQLGDVHQAFDVHRVEAWLKCKYMREHLGEEYGGVVSSATTFGIFVTLDAMYVEGLVHITELGGEYFKFDEMRQELRGERTGIRYAIGTRVRVQVSRVDLDGRKIDFRLIREGEDLLSRAMKDKGVAPSSAGTPTKAAGKRAGQRQSHAPKERDRDRERDRGDAVAAVAAAAERPVQQSAMQAFKSAVKKAANKMKGRKPRRP